MKKPTLFIITGILLIGIVIGATIIDKTFTIDKTLSDWVALDAKASTYQFEYSEKEMSDGNINVCVYKVDYTKIAMFQRIPIGCETITDNKLADETEQRIVESFLLRQKEQSEYVAPSVTKETIGAITLK